MRTTKIETWCPLFPGFYNTLYDLDTDKVLEGYNENDDWHHEERKEKGYSLDEEIEYDDLEIDNEGYEKALAKIFVEFVEKKLKPYVVKINLQNVSSPKQYNYENDSINIEVEIDLEAIKKFFENKEVLKSYSTFLKAIYTSCDGFISSYSNDVDVWLEDIKRLPDIENIEHKMGSILEFILEYEKELVPSDDDLEIYNAVTELISASEFCSLKQKEEE